MAHATRFDFTNRAIKALPAHASAAASHAAEYSDSSFVGLKLSVGKTGRKTFQFRYLFGGGKRCARIGEWPGIDVAEARKIAMQMRAQLDRGIDPQEGRHGSKTMPTFEAFAREEFLPFVSKVGKRTAKDDESKIRNHFLNAFGPKRLCDITRRDVELYHAAVRKSHAPATANRHLALLSAMFRRAIEWGRVDRSPCAGVKAFPENNASTRWLSDDEIARLYAAMDADRNKVAAAALKFLLLCGARRNEVAKMRWDEVDLERRQWTLRGDRTKSGRTRRVVLSSGAVDLLMAQPSRGVSPYVFPGRDGPDKPIDNLSKPFARMLEAAGIERGTGVDRLKVHSLRHSHASHLLLQGISLEVIADQLGHAGGGAQITRRYAHVADRSRVQAAEAMSAVIDRAVAARTVDDSGGVQTA